MGINKVIRCSPVDLIFIEVIRSENVRSLAFINPKSNTMVVEKQNPDAFPLSSSAGPKLIALVTPAPL